MDFWTTFPYWGIIILVILNAWLVINRSTTVEERDGEEVGH